MIRLAEQGKKVVVYEKRGDELVKRKCRCNRVHIIMKKETNKYIKCKCGRLVEL